MESYNLSEQKGKMEIIKINNILKNIKSKTFLEK